MLVNGDSTLHIAVSSKPIQRGNAIKLVFPMSAKCIETPAVVKMHRVVAA